MSTWTEQERTVVLSEKAFLAVIAMAMLTGIERSEVVSNLVLEGTESSLRKARLINQMRGDS